MRSLAIQATLLLSVAVSAQSFVDYESGPVAAVRVSADGSRLFAADTLGGRLVVFDLSNPSAPFLVAEIPVGVDPVSVNPRTRDEVWVCNQVSDSVSIVDVPARRVVATLRVVDEPSDVVFAGGRAFVSAATTDEVHVFDAVTRTPLGVIPIFGKDPRALATSSDGSRVYAVVQRSGNGTTTLPAAIAPPPPPPTNVLLPPAPQQGLIVRADDPVYAAAFPFTLPDHDVAEIDPVSMQVTRYYDAVGTTNTGIAVHPTTGELWIANTEARNLVRFEPNLRGHAIDSRLTRIIPGGAATVTAFDLNPGIDYNVLPNPAAKATALAEPFGVAIDGATGRVFVAAHGTDRIGVVDSAGNVIARIELGAPGAQVATRSKRGPRALALHPSAARLYVLNRLSDTLAVIDTQSLQLLSELPLATVDPMPAAIREGRNFLYDAKLSGNGTMSCAACHVDGDIDGIAWDLGDPGGDLTAPPSQPFPFNLGLLPFHPMKGPMTTQTLRGLEGTGVLHWRGDRADFQAFNPAFDSLMGGSMLSNQDMDDYAAFANAIAMPPNPNQLLDRSLRTTPPNNNEAAGQVAFNANVVGLGNFGLIGCHTCHTLPTGTNGMVISGSTLQESQQFKVAQLRNLYRKVGMLNAPGPQKSGFGFVHDGSIDTLTTFLAQPVFNPWPAQQMDDIVTFLLSLDTGTAPLVGYQFMLTQANANTPQLAADAQLVTTRAAAGDIDLTAHGIIDGVLTGLLYQPGSDTFVTDRPGVGPFTPDALRVGAAAGTIELAFTAVPPGTGARIALDRDGDGLQNGSERPAGYGTASPGCSGDPELLANSGAFVGNVQFGYVMRNAQANSFGVIALALQPASLPVLGIEVLVDPATAVTQTIASDTFGDAVHSFPIPANPSLVGAGVFAQALWLDWCGPQLWASSAGLELSVQP
ncbi:MAG TPA: hypothetical protein ENI87_00230 [bacterium]|nr:hypothetical protein [bacterium]